MGLGQTMYPRVVTGSGMRWPVFAATETATAMICGAQQQPLCDTAAFMHENCMTLPHAGFDVTSGGCWQQRLWKRISSSGRRPQQLTADRSRKCITKPHSWLALQAARGTGGVPEVGGLWVLLSAQQLPVLGDLALW